VPTGLLGDVVVGEGVEGGAAADTSDSPADDDGAGGVAGFGGGGNPHTLSVTGCGMDWGSVLLYTCSADCKGRTVEWLQVLPPT
jgi:hypothetical protein